MLQKEAGRTRPKAICYRFKLYFLHPNKLWIVQVQNADLEKEILSCWRSQFTRATAYKGTLSIYDVFLLNLSIRTN